jgi:hypothetical protein
MCVKLLTGEDDPHAADWLAGSWLKEVQYSAVPSVSKIANYNL